MSQPECRPYDASSVGVDLTYMGSYSLGTVIVPLEAAGFFIFFFVFPLAFSLTAFLMWISES